MVRAFCCACLRGRCIVQYRFNEKRKQAEQEHEKTNEGRRLTPKNAHSRTKSSPCSRDEASHHSKMRSAYSCLSCRRRYSANLASTHANIITTSTTEAARKQQ